MQCAGITNTLGVTKLQKTPFSHHDRCQSEVLGSVTYICLLR
jgi:hypothetical protein